MRVTPEEFRKLALGEMEAVYRLAYHLARQPEDADDLVQEAYLRAFRSAESYKPSDHGVRPWLFKILHNVINTRLSQQLRHREILEELRHQSAPPPSVPDLSQIDWERIDERLKAAIAELSPAQRTAFLLCAVEGMTYREIAEITEVPIGTVMSRLYRARAVLAERLVSLATERGLHREQKEVIEGFGRPS